MPKSFKNLSWEASKTFQNEAQEAPKSIPKSSPIPFGGLLESKWLSKLIFVWFFFQKCFKMISKSIQNASKIH